MNETAPAPKPVESKFSATKLGVIAVAILVLVGIGLVMLLRTDPESASAYEIAKRERKIEALTEENGQLKRELHDLRDDYARMVAERRCEVIDGMDDCLAAGLPRPERFRESDAALLRAREAEKARKLAAVPVTPPKSGAGQPPPDGKEDGIATLLKLLKSIPGVKTD